MRVPEHVEDLVVEARRGEELGVRAPDLAGLEPFLKRLPGIIVVDHMGRPDVTSGVDHPDFQRFIDLMAGTENIWTKVTCPERLSGQGPPYDDVVPFA